MWAYNTFSDIGKIYGTVAIITAIIPLISNPIYKQLYNFVSSSLLLSHRI